MCVTSVTCEVRVCGLRCRSGSSLYIYRVYLLTHTFESMRRLRSRGAVRGGTRGARVQNARVEAILAKGGLLLFSVNSGGAL